MAPIISDRAQADRLVLGRDDALAGRPRAISRARFGPDMAAIRPPASGISSPMTWVMRMSVLVLDALGHGQQHGVCRAMAGPTAPRSIRASRPPARRRRPARSRRRQPTRIRRDLDLDREADVRQVALVARLRQFSCAACARHARAGRPARARARCSASVVPQAPAPTTARRAWRPSSGALRAADLARAPSLRCSWPLGAWPVARLRSLFLPRALADDQPQRRAVEAERLAKPVLEVAPVAEVDARRAAGEEHEGRRLDLRPGSRRRSRGRLPRR